MSSRRKPAKVQSSTKKEDIGKPVLVIHLGSSRFTCANASCGRSFRRGMTYEHGHRSYCSRRCLKAVTDAS